MKRKVLTIGHTFYHPRGVLARDHGSADQAQEGSHKNDREVALPGPDSVLRSVSSLSYGNHGMLFLTFCNKMHFRSLVWATQVE